MTDEPGRRDKHLSSEKYKRQHEWTQNKQFRSVKQSLRSFSQVHFCANSLPNHRNGSTIEPCESHLLFLIGVGGEYGRELLGQLRRRRFRRSGAGRRRRLLQRGARQTFGAERTAAAVTAGSLFVAPRSIVEEAVRSPVEVVLVALLQPPYFVLCENT